MKQSTHLYCQLFGFVWELKYCNSYQLLSFPFSNALLPLFMTIALMFVMFFLRCHLHLRNRGQFIHMGLGRFTWNIFRRWAFFRRTVGLLLSLIFLSCHILFFNRLALSWQYKTCYMVKKKQAYCKCGYYVFEYSSLWYNYLYILYILGSLNFCSLSLWKSTSKSLFCCDANISVKLVVSNAVYSDKYPFFLIYYFLLFSIC